MLLMVEKGVIGEICQPVHRYAKTNKKYMKNYDKSIKPSSYLAYLDANNFYGWVMSQNLMINGFKWVEKLSRFNERFIKNYNKNSDREYFLEADVKYQKKLRILHSYLPFLPERKKVGKVEKLVCDIGNKKNMLFT